MWCLISQSNSMVFEVRVDPKSIGQECLEKVRIFCKFYLKLAGDILKPENANLFFFSETKNTARKDLGKDLPCLPFFIVCIHLKTPNPFKMHTICL